MENRRETGKGRDSLSVHLVVAELQVQLVLLEVEPVPQALVVPAVLLTQPAVHGSCREQRQTSLKGGR